MWQLNNFLCQLPREAFWSTSFPRVRISILKSVMKCSSDNQTVRHLPDWFPGAGFKRTAALWAESLRKTVEQPYQLVKKEMVHYNFYCHISRSPLVFASQAAGTAEPSFTSHLLDDPATAEQEHEIKWSAASLYSGGADTACSFPQLHVEHKTDGSGQTVASIHAFFLAIVLHPDVMRKAQAELDDVVGQDRLPNFSDRERLPYINALVLEVIRWHSVVPSGNHFPS